MIDNFNSGSKYRIMVCITPQRSCERLIKAGHDRAKEMKGEFSVVYVNKDDDLHKHLEEHDILLELFNKAQAQGGSVSILSGKKIYETLAEFAKNNEVNEIIVGKSLRSAFDNQQVINPLKKCVERNNIHVNVID
ncbi:universal stress protein UspA [Calorimonas adulescens]|jgi:Universal stress protein family.|uniref:Universal stress protein UspA n=1 Tax=Calorimonas adulescens TaxID=2606906 RepID=A0A5D8QI19_9THEO|nr:universal stress protein UspA [Calorimonas adulescens]TZE83203.1 universal stress protein UspA [Calorimonas adulescens]